MIDLKYIALLIYITNYHHLYHFISICLMFDFAKIFAKDSINHTDKHGSKKK